MPICGWQPVFNTMVSVPMSVMTTTSVIVSAKSKAWHVCILHIKWVGMRENMHSCIKEGMLAYVVGVNNGGCVGEHVGNVW